jgi:hypothetical protein
MKHLKAVFLCTVLALCQAVMPSVLSNLAANLPARTWVKMPANSSLTGLSLHYSLLYWNDSGIWDPVRKQVRWVGGPGTCCANPALYKLIKYDDATNTWSVEGTPFSGSGHAYDGNACDPANGDHYFTIFEEKRVRWWAGAAWAMLPEFPHAAQATMAVAWFPELNGGLGGLVHVAGYGSVAWYTGYRNGNTWTPIGGAGASAWGSYNTFAEYSPAHKVVWMGGGNGADRVNYLLDTNLNLTKMSNAPVSLNNGQTLKSCDPVSGNYIICGENGGDFREFNPKTGNWSSISMNNTPSLNSTFHVPIPEYGVILYFSFSDPTKEAWLYRHTLGTGPIPRVEAGNVMPTADILKVSPNPFNAAVAITVHGNAVETLHFQGKFHQNEKCNVSTMSIYDPHGRMVHRAENIRAGRYTWSPANLPAGIYLVKARLGNRIAVKRILLQK